MYPYMYSCTFHPYLIWVFYLILPINDYYSSSYIGDESYRVKISLLPYTVTNYYLKFQEVKLIVKLSHPRAVAAVV